MKRLFLCLALLFITQTVFGDSWFLEQKNEDTEFIFGETKIILNYNSLDAIGKTNFPNYTIKLLKNNQLIVTFENTGFEEIFASKGEQYFLGVSVMPLLKQALFKLEPALC